MYLSGAINDGVRQLPNCGYMLTPMMANRPDLSSVFWANDTGCFARPEAFSVAGYAAWLASLAQYRRTCLFATAPDRFGDGPATLAVARPVLPIIRALGYPAALVVQPGITAADLPWGELDCIFVGGPDAWQRSATVAAIRDEARRRGKWTHKGRVNSERRLRAAAADGYDSADGTYLAFGPDTNLPKLAGWLARLDGQQRLEVFA